MAKKRTQFDTKAEMRVVLAKDVLTLLKQKRFTVLSGEYCSSATLNELLQLKHCHGCAMGALFVAAVDRFNKLNLRESATSPMFSDAHFSHSVVRPYMGNFFSKKQFLLIETAFEGEVIESPDNLSLVHRRFDPINYRMKVDGPPSVVASLALAKRVSRPRSRLEAILKNIVRNGGQFVPSQLAGEKAA